MMPPVGKSGPSTSPSSATLLISASTGTFGSSISMSAAVHSSAALCGGIDVAMPTAMPDEPLASRFGKAPGRTIGSSSSSL